MTSLALARQQRLQAAGVKGQSVELCVVALNAQALARDEGPQLVNGDQPPSGVRNVAFVQHAPRSRRRQGPIIHVKLNGHLVAFKGLLGQ
ncbi:hypothetical protein D3C72_1371250 [compost metagenome]